MILDDVHIEISAGAGGAGAVKFQKIPMMIGPTGGNGGRGGSVYFRSVADLGALEHYRRKKDFHAKDGEHGRGQFVDGKDGEDLFLPIPVGTVIEYDDEGKDDQEVLKIGEEILVASGGRGGKGNFKFRSPTNTTPKEAQPGTDGELLAVHLSLKLIADVGFVGLPNVGKSTLLNTLTNAQSKTANYPFTTLEPHLGAYYELILADIPGLIEGASGGKGLGHKFLRHIERTEVLFHFLAADSLDPVSDYQVIRRELEKFNPKLIEKKEYIIISRADEVNEEELKETIKNVRTLGREVHPVSIYDDDSLKGVKKVLSELLEEKKGGK